MQKAIKDGLDIEQFCTCNNTYFPEDLDNMTVADIGIANCRIKSIPKSGHFYIDVVLRADDGRTMRARAMIDSGAEGIFLNQSFVEKNQVPSDSAPPSAFNAEPKHQCNFCNGSLNEERGRLHFAAVKK